MRFDVKKAQSILKMYADTGKTRVQLQELLRLCLAEIDNWPEKYERLGNLCKTHDSCNLSEF